MTFQNKFNMSQLPLPSLPEKQSSEELKKIIVKEIQNRNNFLPFDEYVNLVLYFPQMGYYAGNQEKFGKYGDYVTAPNIHSIFAQTLAKQAIEVLETTPKNIYEFGAGTGDLAADLLNYIPPDLIEHYFIFDISNHLTSRQLSHIKKKTPFYTKVIHLSSLPDTFEGLIIGNEILDAIPFHLIEKHQQNYFELGVTCNDNHGLVMTKRLLTNQTILSEAREYLFNCPEPYQTELHIQQKAFIQTIAKKLGTAAAIFIDYGFEASQYYHPQRNMGTMIGHYKHYTIFDPFFYPGLADITCHINFSAIADSIEKSQVDLMGYTSQANFLLNLGILENLAQISDTSSREYLHASQACQILLNPHEMGELFKVIAFSNNIDINWSGFSNHDWTYKL